MDITTPLKDEKTGSQDIAEALSYISGFQFHGFRLGLERIKAILKVLGDPHHLYPCIHVAGTNGKGSVCATLTQILTEAGYKVGLYTSPHLYSLNERFRIGQEQITPLELADLIFRIREFIKRGYELSYFEYTTAIAFKWFQERHVDIAVIETGLGGRLDATNVIMPLVSIITNVEFDHQSYLGNTLEKIAWEKAGIIKDRVPVVSGERKREPAKVISKRARELGCSMRTINIDFFLRQKGPLGIYEYKGDRASITGIRPGLLGAHQVANTSLAIAAIEELIKNGINISDSAIRAGCERVRWPGRAEFLKDKRVILDGAHNMAGVLALKSLLIELSLSGPFTLLWACSNEGGDKDFLSMLSQLQPLFQKIVITEPPGPRAPVKISQWKDNLDASKGIVLEGQWERALEMGLEACKKGGHLCVAGSLYLVGAVREKLL